MRATLVAIPFAKGRARIHVWKGRVWSLIEHLLLDALARDTLTIEQLAGGFNLPRRVVTECLIRLMRVNWLHMTRSNDKLGFAATPAGDRASGMDELPTAGRNISRAPTYYYDRIVGHVFRNRGLRVMERGLIEKRYEGQELIWIEPRQGDLQFDISEFASVMLEDDERIINIDHPTENWTNRFLIASVHGENITGLPEGDYPDLHRAILTEAGADMKSRSLEDIDAHIVSVAYPRRTAVPTVHNISFSPSDLTLSGPAHRILLQDMVRNAQSRVILHSTFINEDKFADLLPMLAEAVRRGVQIDILWGQNDDRDDVRLTGAAIAHQLIGDAQLSGLDGLIIHPFSTQSHSKWILADCEQGGDFGLAVGSCNWLSSGFYRAEASVRLRDPSIISEFMLLAAEMTRAHNGLWNSLTNELIRLSGRIGVQRRRPHGSARASLVIDEQHSHFVLRARDEAQKRIFLTSHRLGPSAWPGILVPIMAACRAGKVQAQIHFGRFDRIRKVAQSEWVAAAQSKGVDVIPAELAGLHAKVLGWDDRDLVISSLNWLSAHPMAFRAAREIGVWIDAPGVTSAAISALGQTCKTSHDV